VKLQADVISAAPTATIAAFTAPHDNPATDSAMIQYVATFVPKMTGGSYNPHVSVGVAPTNYLDKMIGEPFPAFSFWPAGAGVYQLGPYGTAAKRLMVWDSEGNSID